MKFSPEVNPNQVLPSVHMNTNTSRLEAVVVRVGAVPPGQRTVPGQVTVNGPPEAFCTSSSVNDNPAVAVGKVNVQLAFRV